MTHVAPILPRTVKPRAAVAVTATPIIAVTDTIVWVERTGRYYDPSQLPEVLKAEPSSLVVCEGMARLLLKLHARFKDDERWQFAVSPLERERWTANRTATAVVTRDSLVNFFGWKGAPLPDGPRGGKRKSKNHYHTTLDPVTFAGKGARQQSGHVGGTDIDALVAWAIEVRQFCFDNGLKVKPTSGGLAGQLLRDARFYPDARRKVPSATNAKARPNLPGNHYRLYESEEHETEAYYLDQKAAHHNCALTLTFPCSNRMYAIGHYKKDTLERGVPRQLEAKALSFHGLFHLMLTVPTMPPGTFPPPWAERPGQHAVWVHSNELHLLPLLRITLDHIISAYVSSEVDTGLNEYARWALEQITPQPESPWIKPVLLASYGILAAKPRIHRVGYANAVAGVPKLYPAGAGHLPVMERATKWATEPGYTNVVHRGMIEAETRLRSLALARDMYARGFRVIACYADSVFIATRDRDGENIPLPLLPPGWEVEGELTRLVFHNPVSFSSDQLTKMPGIPARDVVLRSSFGTRHGILSAARASLANASGQPADTHNTKGHHATRKEEGRRAVRSPGP